MTVNIALFLSADGIALAHRQAAGHWAMIGETPLAVSDLGAALSKLREEAVAREGDNFKTLLVLPDDQMLYTSLTAPTSDPELTAFRIEEGLDGMTPYAVTELEYDWRMLEEDRVKIAVVARETLEEAKAFAAQYGFDGAGFAAMPPMERFPGVPTFDVEGDSDQFGFSADGIAFGPDTHGQPEPEPEAEPEPANEAEAAPETDAEAEAATAAEAEAEADQPRDEPLAAQDADEEPSAATAEAATDDPADDAVQARGVAPVPAEDQNPALAEALAMTSQDDLADIPAIDDISTPVQPISDEPVEDAASGDDPLPPAPPPAAREARQRARIIRGEAPTPALEAPADGEPQFSARRGRVAAPDTPAGSLVGQRSSRIGLSHPEGTGSTTDNAKTAAEDAAPASDAPAGPNAGMPRLAEQLQRVRNASKAKPKAGGPAAPQPPRPRVEIEPRPPEEQDSGPQLRASPFDGPPPGQSDEMPSGAKKGLLGGALRGRGGAAKSTAGPAAAGGGLGGLLRRDKTPEPETAVAADGTAVAEDENFTSGLLARKSVPSSGPSFKTGLILTVVLLLLLALVAIWSAVFLPNSAVARLFGFGGNEQVAGVETGDNAPDVFTQAPTIGGTTTPSLEDEAAADGIDLAALPDDSGTPEGVLAPNVDEGDLPDIDAELDLPPLPPIDQGQNPSLEEAEALYAEDGIWARSPERPDLRPFDLLDRIYTASIDPQIAALDAVALPDPGVNPGELLRRFPPPPPFGVEFDLTDQGLVAATPQGVVTPEGAFVVSGTPPVAARQRPREIEEETPAIDVDDAVLGTFRPTARPANLAELRERAVLGGLTQNELGERRPTERPQSPQEAAAAASLFPADGGVADEDVDAAVSAAIGGTDLAVARSLLPSTRPSNISQIVASADRRPVEQPTAVEVAAVAPGPDIPSNADVSRAATERNAIRLRNVNLIGVTGTNSDRRALVRLSSGRFVRVAVGDRLDGGRVAAIGETTLQYVRNGRTVTLEIPG
ncbi:hypothetical protein [Gymnodinialimonas hymeniacidonis]|uniref:hypothetical protein n=1 Tax=Gymnodinialimonas hymeniacidonis TaxID=3126508 RepID=UPI0034C6134B